jgi:hypothetical protein
MLAVARAGYRLPGADEFYCLGGDGLQDRLQQGLAQAGFQSKSADQLEIGDVGQFLVDRSIPHLAISTTAGFVNAHSGLGRVVEMAPPPHWRLVLAWELTRE